MRFSKKIPKIYYSFFFFKKEIIGHMYICTKYNHDFKFAISLKTFSKNMIYMFCLHHFSVKCIINKNY